ncbi:MAG: hypothetical protein N3A57_08025 [Negativicutes bacterium]|nr:hypothetical protein [Negativicutes bacterium]
MQRTQARDTAEGIGDSSDKFARWEKKTREIGAAGEYQASTVSGGAAVPVGAAAGSDERGGGHNAAYLVRKRDSWGYDGNARAVAVDINIHGDLALSRFDTVQYPVGGMVDILF